MIGDMSQDMAQISAWVDIVEFAGSDERVHRSGALTPAIGSGKEEVFSAKAYTTQRILREVVVYFHHAIIAVQRECGPLIERVVDRLGRL